MSCPECDARRKKEAERKQADQRDQDYLGGFVFGGLTVGLPAAWLHDWLGGPSLMMPATFIGCGLGVLWVYWRRDKFMSGR